MVSMLKIVERTIEFDMEFSLTMKSNATLQTHQLVLGFNMETLQQVGGIQVIHQIKKTKLS